MVSPLLAKELRDQRPFLWLALFFVGLEVLESLWTEPLGFDPLAENFVDAFKADGAESLLTFLLAFALGSGLLVREQDDGTLEFLDALPTSRWSLFGMKLLVALGMVMVCPLGMSVWMFIHHAFSLNSLDSSLHLDLLWQGSVLRATQAFVVLSLALALAPLRRLCWTALAALMVGQALLEDHFPWMTALNPLRLTAPEFEGTRWRWPVEALRLQLSLASVLLALALIQFLGLGERLMASLQRRLQSSWAGPLATLTTVALFLAATYMSVDRDEAKEPVADSRLEGVEFPTTASAQAVTRYYHFTYPASLSRRTEPLLQEADPIFEQVRTFLGVEAGAEPLQVDLTGSARNTAGTAYWNTLRMDLAGLSEPGKARAVLGHETVHVLAQRLTGVEAAPDLARMKLLSEGLATYVEYRFFRAPGEQEALDLVAAVARARREVKTEELLQPDRLAAERDEDWVYPLGRTFIEALVRRHGDGAPARVLAALGREGVPEGLDDALAWQDAFQSAGIDLSQVLDDFYVSLDAQVTRHRTTIDALPRPRGVLEREEGQVGIRALVDGALPEGWELVCRFRPEEEAGSHQFDGPYEGAGPHWRAPSVISEGRLWYQLGLKGPQGLVLYEPWTLVRVQ